MYPMQHKGIAQYEGRKNRAEGSVSMVAVRTERQAFGRVCDEKRRTVASGEASELDLVRGCIRAEVDVLQKDVT